LSTSNDYYKTSRTNTWTSSKDTILIVLITRQVVRIPGPVVRTPVPVVLITRQIVRIPGPVVRTKVPVIHITKTIRVPGSLVRI